MAKRKKRRKHVPETGTATPAANPDAASQRPRQGRSQVTAGKLIRLGLKSVVFALVVSTLVTVLGLLNVAIFKTIWFQMGTMLAVYLLAYPYLMREFRASNKPAARPSTKKSR